MLQEEVRKLHIALSEERKVTEKLSRNLELEKRRSESLEQKAKNAFRKSSQANTSNTAVFLPEEMRYRDEQLADKMEKYTDQIERVTMSLQECEEKLTGFEIQVKISGLATVASSRAQVVLSPTHGATEPRSKGSIRGSGLSPGLPPPALDTVAIIRVTR